MIGRTLSHYKILEKIGSGGMGEVYLAEDTKLARKVALKILPPAMATGERRKRFEREAKAVAALEHPNIVTVYSVEESGGVPFYTMQLVKGQTVTELIPKDGLPLHKFFEVAIPLADAVAAAHACGIVHRDLKPDNLMLSEEGRLKILDFGLAKLRQGRAEPGMSELPTQSATREGRILGTVAYMSPEQAEGKPVDHRSDIFSIGIVLYEMATGERPFKGDTTASLLSSILRDTPRSATKVNPGLPRELGKIIRRCLGKEPGRRYQSALDLRNELEELKQEVDSGDLMDAVNATPSSRLRRRLPTAMTAVAAAAAAFAIYLIARPGPRRAPTRVTFTQVTSQAGEETFPALSPDGDFVAYVSAASGNLDVYLLRVGGENAVNLTADSVAADTQPAFSPDGELLAFRSERDGGGIFLMGATGESVRRLTDFGYNPVWSPDGEEIVCATQGVVDPVTRWTTSQLWAVDVASGRRRLITEGDAVQPHWSPHGHRIAYWALRGDSGQRDLWTVAADGGVAVPVTNDTHVDWNPVWSPDGDYLYFSSDRGGSMNLWRVPIEEESGEVLGEPQTVTTGASASRQHLSFSRDGRRISYVERVDTANLEKVAFDPVTETVEGPPAFITRGSEPAAAPDVSPDGEWLAFYSSGRTQEDLFIVRPDGTGRRQLTNDADRDRAPRWSPDGSRIAFMSDRSGLYQIWTIRPDGSGLQQMTAASVVETDPVWSPDGWRVAYNLWDPKPTYYIRRLGEPLKEQIAEALPALDQAGEFLDVTSWSPDGKWLAGTIRAGDGTSSGIAIYSLESREYERLSDFGIDPVWLNDSRRLLFRDSGQIFLIDRQSGKAHEVLSVEPDVVGERISVSHDDRWVYFSRFTSEADIWMLTYESAKRSREPSRRIETR